jgi:class 3 adenylate cyclase
MNPKRFRVAFSFAGEKRDFVAKVAAILAKRFGEQEILYDRFHEAEFARRNLGFYLPDLYYKESELVVVVLSANYDIKQWTGLEWTAIHDLLSKRRDWEVMLCRFDHATVAGLYSTAGFIELDEKTPEQAANLILERLALNEGKPKAHYLPSTSLTKGSVRDLIFISYSHSEKLWQQKLRRVLDADPALRDLVWDDTKIRPGAPFTKEIAEHVERARVMVMLASEDYFRPNSGATSCETVPALQAHERGEMDIFWVPVKAHNYRKSPVGHLMAATGPGALPLENLDAAGQNRALQLVREQIRECLGLLNKAGSKKKTAAPGAKKVSKKVAPSSPDDATQPMKKTIVELDLQGYSDVARELEDHFSAELVMRFNEQIQTFVVEALGVAKVLAKDAMMATTGDGAILIFDAPSVAHIFAEAVHDITRLHNYEKKVAAAQRWFRIGIATGDVAIKDLGGEKRMAGSVIGRAVRLEAAAQIGEILADAETYAGFSREQRARYGAEEQIPGKRNELFPARRYTVVAGLVIPAVAGPGDSGTTKPAAAIKKWQQKLDFLQEELAIVATPAQKFEIKCQIEEAKEKIAELGK